jgi:hypothetical protein
MSGLFCFWFRLPLLFFFLSSFGLGCHRSIFFFLIRVRFGFGLLFGDVDFVCFCLSLDWVSPDSGLWYVVIVLFFFFQFGFDGNDSLSVSDGCGWWMVLENGLWFWLMKVYWWKIMIIATEIVRKKRETILFLFFWCRCRFWVTIQRRNFWFGYSAAFPPLALEFVSEFILTN